MAAYVTCRILNRNGNQCTAEAVDPSAELLICTGTWPKRFASCAQLGFRISRCVA
ncbi:hypothetical protein [Streptomyces sp. NBC_01518]|uniref:hypothetical protein n=1 Tax=Streptomyces sp. NBC_01518 TaxID=2903891 RepID=UPI003866D9D1